MWLMFETEMLIYQSNDNLDEKILFYQITHQLDPETRKMHCWKGGMFGNKDPHSLVVCNLLSIEIKMLFLKLTM